MYFAYEQLSALAAVIRQGSFDGAARVLHVTPSAVSQRIKQLEEHLGAIVVVRARRCAPTELGAAVYRHAQQVELLEKDLLGTLAPEPGEAAPQTTVAMAANADSLATWLVPALARVVAETGARVDVAVDDEDNTAEWLRSGRVLGAVTSEARAVQGCRVHALGAMRYRATASRSFIDRSLAGGVTLAALRRAPVLAFDRKDVLAGHFLRQRFGKRAADPPLVHFLPSPHAIVEATLLGQGWSVNPERLVDGLIARKELVDLFPGRFLDVALFWQQWALRSRSLEVLATTLSEEAAKSLHRGRRG
jgi:LysR family transcriptional regulator, chromosome initiation inhibitor